MILRRLTGPERKKVCKHGHPLYGDNLRIEVHNGTRRRVCLECKKMRNAARDRTPEIVKANEERLNRRIEAAKRFLEANGYIVSLNQQDTR